MSCLRFLLAGLLLVSCVSPPPSSPIPRRIDPPAKPPMGAVVIYQIPTPSWPIRYGWVARQSGPVEKLVNTWGFPSPQTLPEILSSEVVAAAPLPVPTILALPLPEIRLLPAKQTPLSRSWTSISQVKTANFPVPAPVAAAIAKPDAKPSVPDEKAPATVAAKPQPVPVLPKASPTAASTASLLPVEKSTSSDFRWEDVNAVAGDAVTLHFDKTNWLYLDSPVQQKTLGFQSIQRDKDATTFQFKPLVPGQYTLEFQRQDLINQTTDSRKIRLSIAAAGTRTSSNSTVLSPQTSKTAQNDALEASRQLAAAGKTSEAVQRLLQSYKAEDTRVNLELARLLNQDGQDSEALSYLDKNLTLTGPDFQGTLELGTRLAATKEPQTKLPAYVKLWASGTSAPPEDLFVQVFETLRLQKMTALAKDWSGRYGLWYPAPKLKDRYLFQLGQLLEEPGEGRDVKAAWKAYNEVVQSHPLSPFWKAAGERASYLNRTFLQVR